MSGLESDYSSRRWEAGPASRPLPRLAVAPGHWRRWRGRLAIVNYLVYAEVGNVTSKCNGGTSYRLCHVLRAITLTIDNVSNFDREWGDPAFLTLSSVSLVQWTNRLLPVTGGRVCAPGVQPTHWNWDYLIEPSRYSGDPDVIPDQQL